MKQGGGAYDNDNLPIRLLIAQTLLHRLPLRPVQVPIGESDPRLSRGQLGPLQRMERVFRKENFPNEWAGEEDIRALERIPDKVRAVDFGIGEFILANRDD